jgi:hypothetical protein
MATSTPRSARPLKLVALAFVCLALVLGASGCGSTKVSTAQKSIAYKDRIYNISLVREVRGVREVILPGGETRNLNSLGDRARRDLFDEYDEFRVRMRVLFDDTELMYFDRSVRNRRDLNALERRFDGAMEEIRRFMANRRQTQLELD